MSTHSHHKRAIPRGAKGATMRRHAVREARERDYAELDVGPCEDCPHRDTGDRTGCARLCGFTDEEEPL